MEASSEHPQDRLKDKHVATYSRVSTKKQQLKGDSIPAQQQFMQRLIERYGGILVHEYADAGISGKTVEARVDFRRMLEDAKTRRDFDVILAVSDDRLFRNHREAENVLEELRGYDVEVRFADMFGIDIRTPIGKVVFRSKSALSEFYVEYIREKTSFGMQEKGRTFHMGRPPSLFRCEDVIDPTTGQRLGTVVVPDDERVLRVWSARAAGESYRQISAETGLDVHKVHDLVKNEPRYRRMMDLFERSGSAKTTPSDNLL